MNLALTLLVAIAALLGWGIWTYNRLVRLRDGKVEACEALRYAPAPSGT